MKTIILLTIFLFCIISNAGWVEKLEVKNDPKIWTKKAMCVASATDGICLFVTTAQDLRRWKAGVVDSNDVLVADTVGSDALDVELAAASAEQTTRDDSVAPRLVRLRQCVQDSKVAMTNLQRDTCIKALVREQLGKRAAASDL